MADERYAARAARVLGGVRARLSAHAGDDPEATIARLQEAIVAGARRRRRRRLLVSAGAGLAAAAGAALVVLRPAVAPVAPPPARPSIIVEDGAGRWRGAGDTRIAVAGDVMTAGTTLATDEAPLALRSADGTHLLAGPHTELGLTRDDTARWFRLTRGAVSLAVAKLLPGQRFVVETPDRQVEVKGTRFEVRLSPSEGCGGGTVTRVAVVEGAVTVRDAGGGEQVLEAGERWPAGCTEAPPAQREVRPPSSPARPAAPPRVRAPRSAPEVVAAPPQAPAASTLGVQNDLFAAAMRAGRAGDRASAVRALDQLLLRYPGSPLREAAVAERLKLLGPPERE